MFKLNSLSNIIFFSMVLSSELFSMNLEYCISLKECEHLDIKDYFDDCDENTSDLLSMGMQILSKYSGMVQVYNKRKLEDISKFPCFIFHKLKVVTSCGKYFLVVLGGSDDERNEVQLWCSEGFLIKKFIFDWMSVLGTCFAPDDQSIRIYLSYKNSKKSIPDEILFICLKDI